MDIVSPSRLESQVWLRKFNGDLQAWLATRRLDPRPYRDALEALRHMVEREPATAGFAARLTSSLARQHGNLLAPTDLERTATRGLDAIRLIVDDSEARTIIRCNLLHHRAEARMALRRWAAMLGDLAASRREMRRVAPLGSPLAPLLEAHHGVLEGRAREALLDFELALPAYEAAARAAGLLADEPSRLADTLAARIALEFDGRKPPQEAINAEVQLLWREVSMRRIDAVVGAARCAPRAAPETVDRHLAAIEQVARLHGLGGTTPLELAAVVREASPAAAEAAVAGLIEAAGRVGLPIAEFTAVLEASLCAGALVGEGLETHRETAEAALADVEDPLATAAARGLLLLASAPGDIAALSAFTEALRRLDAAADLRLADPANRAVFDEPVLVALHRLALMGEGALPWDRETRTLVARLVDYDFAARTPLDDWLGTEAAEEPLRSLADLARDRLGRARLALEDRPATAVLVLRTVHGRTLFLGLSDDGEPSAELASPAYAAAADALVDHLRADVDRVAEGDQPTPPERLRTLGSEAWAALPPGVTALIERSERILVCPDHRHGGGTAPFELFYDGDDWLGTSRTVARFPDLRSLLRYLEGTGRRDHHRRLLAIAVPDAPAALGLPRLALAEDEVAATRAALAGRGWDAPDVTPRRADAEFLLERLPYASHLHIAAHGAATGQQEELLLAGGDVLTTADLLGQVLPRAPSAYLNVCELGMSRWAGAGRSGSIPYAFVRAGSPTVIANLLPVEDRLATTLAGFFYEHAESRPMGPSLRDARRRMADAGVHPLFWGSTVLVGDPDLSLAADESPRPNATQAYLDAAVLGDAEGAAEVAAILLPRLETGQDSRLMAAIGVLHRIEDGGFDADAAGWADVAAACRVAYELDHLPLLAVLLVLARGIVDQVASPDRALTFYDNAIRLLEPLEGEAPVWKNMVDSLLVGWIKAVRGDRLPELQVHGPPLDDDDPTLKAVEALRDIQLAMEARELRRGRGPTARETESTFEDVLRNAVTAPRHFQLDGMREVFDFARSVAGKLVALDALEPGMEDDASAALAGLLNWLWRSQNRMNLPDEMVEGQTGVLQLLVDRLREPWTDQEWYAPLERFDAYTADALAGIEELPYDDELYPAIARTLDGIEETARATLDEIRQRFSERRCEATVWVLGSLIRNNRYSYTQGSVPEHIGDRLTELQHSLSDGSEEALFPWLDRGFASVRETPVDELRRWKYGLEAEGT